MGNEAEGIKKGKIKMKKIMIGFVLLMSSCTNSDATKQTLMDAGYADIEVTGWSVFQCGEDDTFSTGFRARNPKGRLVEGTVCCGLIAKGCTIRH